MAKNLIFGINAHEGLTEITDVDGALKTLGLDPADLSRIGDITGSINTTQFHHLSQASGSPREPLPKNLIERLDSYSKATLTLPLQLEDKAGPSIISTTGLDSTSVKGNIIVNGPVGAPAIRYFSTELLNSDTGEFEPLDISTSRVSSWSRNGTTLTFGGDLKIANFSPAHGAKLASHADGATNIGSKGYTDAGVQDIALNETPHLSIGKIIIDGREQMTTITPRSFPAEQATNKIHVNINGTDMYLYAMKNIPLRFNARFAGGSGTQMSVGAVTAPATDYRVFTGNSFVDRTTIDGNLDYANTLLTSRTIEVYQKPNNIKSITTKSTGLGITNFPDADFTNLETLSFRNNDLTIMPNLSKFTNLTSVNLAGNPLDFSPVNSDPNLNKISTLLLSRFPKNVETLNIDKCFGTRGGRSGEVTGSIKRRFPKLSQFILGEVDSRRLNSPMLPEVPVSTRNYKVGYQPFRTLPGVSQIKEVILGGGTNNSLHGTITDSGFPIRPAKAKVRRVLNQFLVELDSPGKGYKASTEVTFSIDALTTTGAASPQGIPGGKITIGTDADGSIRNTFYEPVKSPEEFNNLLLTFPALSSGGAITRKAHEGGDFSGYSPMSYYVDCGLFSSPCRVNKLQLLYNRAFVSGKYDAYMNPFYSDSVMPGKTSTGSNMNGSTYNATVSQGVYQRSDGNTSLKNFTEIDIRSSLLPIPFLVDHPTLTTFDAANIDMETNQNYLDRVDKIKNVIKTHPGVESVSAWERSKLYTLYDSPTKNSPADDNYSQPGTTGTYKLKGCSNLTSINLENSEVGGTLPIFDGNTKLQTVNVKNAGFNRTQPGIGVPVAGVTVRSPDFLPLNQFVDCRATLKSFEFQRGARSHGERGLAWGTNFQPGTIRTRFGIRNYQNQTDAARPNARYTVKMSDGNVTTSGNGENAIFDITVNNVGKATVNNFQDGRAVAPNSVTATRTNYGFGGRKFEVGDTVTIPDSELGGNGGLPLIFEIAAVRNGAYRNWRFANFNQKVQIDPIGFPYYNTSTRRGPRRVYNAGYDGAIKLGRLHSSQVATSAVASMPAADLPEGSFATDVIGSSLTYFKLQTRNQAQNTGEFQNSFGLSGPFPTFRNATNLKNLNLQHNNFEGPIGPPSTHHIYATDSVGQNLGEGFTVRHQADTLEKLNLAINSARGPIDFHHLCNGTQNTNKGFKKLTEMSGQWNYFSGINNWGYAGDEPNAEFVRFNFFDGFDCPNYSNRFFQERLEPGSVTYSYGKDDNADYPNSGRDAASLWLLDRRKDGTSHKYEHKIPSLQGRFTSKFTSLDLSNWSLQLSRGPFKGFAHDGAFQTFFGTNIRYLQLRGNGFDRNDILDVGRALLNFCQTYNKKFITLDVRWQRGWDSPSGNDPLSGTGLPGPLNDAGAPTGITDYRLNLPSEPITSFHPDSVYRRPDIPASQKKYPTLAENDIWKELTQTYRCNLNGINFSSVPGIPTAPTIFTTTIIGTDANQLHSTRLGSDGIYNLYNWNKNWNIKMDITVNGIAVSNDDLTTELRIFKTRWDGVKSEITEFYVDGRNDLMNNKQTFTLIMDIDGLLGDLNGSRASLPGALNLIGDGSGALPAGTSDVTGYTQTFTLEVQVNGLRPGTRTKSNSLIFKNVVETRTGATADASHPRGEWKLEVEPEE